MPWVSRIPLHQGLKWEPTWKALDTHKLTDTIWRQRLKIKRKVSGLRSCFTSLPFELAAFQFLLVFTHAQGEQWSQGCLWPSRIRFALDSNKKLFTPTDLDTFEHFMGRYYPKCEKALGDLEVKICYHKSLISETGSAEFAKRFRVRGLSVDLSPISIRNLMNSHHPYGLMSVHMTYPVLRFSTLARSFGSEVGIGEFFKAPFVNTKWYLTRTEPSLVRWGLLWKIFDMVALKGVHYRVPILGSESSPLSDYLLGGVSGTSFLVFALGLNQPRADRGVICPGVTASDGCQHPAVKTIRYKTLGVSDRQITLGYARGSDEIRVYC
ncbi:hypothetical protein RJ640_029003 [Escallonia rubra]|uniref:Uncharacterized protein n=1 Tax=Escallonia rubra TaxID=112253 RepID=A0AA88UUE0_9ASTE|nr:hypothetical protein RJ640_029003 [Escallonia rubra]